MASATLWSLLKPKPETSTVGPKSSNNTGTPAPSLIWGPCVSITEVPDAPKQPTVLEVYHDSALIRWEPPADGGKPITGYIIERKETMANR